MLIFVVCSLTIRLTASTLGLSWETVLNKRQAFREAFHGYQIHAVAEMTDTELEDLLENPAIIRNRAKIFATR